MPRGARSVVTTDDRIAPHSEPRCDDDAGKILSFPPGRVAPVEGESDDRPFGKLRRPHVRPMHAQVRVGGCDIRGRAPPVCAPMNERRSQYFDSQRLPPRNLAAFMVEAPHRERRTDAIDLISLYRLRRQIEDLAVPQ